MKRKLIISFYLMCMSLLISAQAFTGGLTGGFSVNQIDGDEYLGYNMLGFTGGAYIQTNNEGRWKMQGEIKYFLKGAEQKLPDNVSFYREHLNYVQIPLMTDFYVNDKFFPEAGLSLGYLFLAREDKDGNGFLAPSPAFNKVDFCFEGGLNYQFTRNIRANIRLSYSITRIRPFPGGQSFLFDMGEYNSSLSFNLYYRILPMQGNKK